MSAATRGRASCSRLAATLQHVDVVVTADVATVSPTVGRVSAVAVDFSSNDAINIIFVIIFVVVGGGVVDVMARTNVATTSHHITSKVSVRV